MFIHHVYFWLKPDAPQSAAAQLAGDCRSLLSGIPGVVHLWAGPPAMTPRDIVDNSYAVGLSVIFADDAGHDVYQKHPLHLEFIERNKPNWASIKAFDFRS
jgi:hypothetical protein